MLKYILDEIAPLEKKLASHPIYHSIKSRDQLKCFMSYHVYSVWDFMNLVKFLQHVFAPSGHPWRPPKNMDIVHFINDIVLEEESDKDLAGNYTSHFELYLKSMEEIGVSTRDIRLLVENFTPQHLEQHAAPDFIKSGIKNTFSYIDDENPHIAADAFCFGRENIIPLMFKRLIDRMNITTDEAPHFIYYLGRHVELDGEIHGPMALKMVDILCKGSPQKYDEAKKTAIASINARIKLWDAILYKIEESTDSQTQNQHA